MKHTRIKASILAAVFFASCATEPPPPPPPPPPPAPAPKYVPPEIIPSAMAPTEQSRSIHNMAGYLTNFVAEAARASTSANMSNSAAISNSVDQSALFARSEMIDGAKAYALLAATNSPEFRAGISQIGTPMGRAEFIRRMRANPAYVKTIPGYENAKSLAASAVNSQFMQAQSASERLKQASYDMQKTNWGKLVQQKQPRIDAVTANYALPLQATGFDATTITGANASDLDVANKIMAAAALYIIRADADALDLLTLGSGKSCAFRAHLNVRQCLSATRFSFEHAYCLSEHGQKEALQCAKADVTEPVYVEYKASIGARPTPPPPPPKTVPKTTTKAKKKK